MLSNFIFNVLVWSLKVTSGELFAVLILILNVLSYITGDNYGVYAANYLPLAFITLDFDASLTFVSLS